MANITLISAPTFSEVYAASVAQLKLAKGVRPRPRKEVADLIFSAGLIPANADRLSVSTDWLAGEDVDPVVVVGDLNA